MRSFAYCRCHRCLQVGLVLPLLFLATLLRAQDNGCDTITNLPWTESFTTGEQGCWTFWDNDGNGHNWIIGDLYPYDGSYSLMCTYSTTQEDNWAISQAIAIPSDAGSTTLTWQVFAHSSYSETYEVRISSNGIDNMEDFEAVYGETVSGGYYERQVDLTQYAGQVVHIAFRHRSLNQNFICIDRIQVAFSPAGDVPNITISAPDSVLVDNEVTLTAICDNGENFAWNLPGAVITSAEGRTVRVVWHETGKYTVSVTASNTNGSSSATKEIVVYSKLSAVQEVQTKRDIVVYPNPTKGVVTVEGEGVLAIELYDLKGTLLNSVNPDATVIDLSDLPKGVYIIRTVSDRGVKSARVIKL